MSSIVATTRHWILNLACEIPCRVSDLLPVVKEERLNVIRIPGVQATDYAAALLKLFDSGEIRLRPRDEDESSSPTRAELNSVLEARLKLPPILRTFGKNERQSGVSPSSVREVPDLSWELSLLGGEEWETLAQPDWTRFATILSDKESSEMWSANFDLLMAELGWCRELNGVEIDRTTLSLELLRDYAITYWKILPIVHHAVFRSKWVDHGWPEKGRREPEWFRKWWVSRSNWYRKPWTLSGWPTA